MPTCAVTRRVHFNAAHRLFNPARSEAWNEQVFGVCSSPNYHGHNYELDVSVTGPVDPETGYVIDINVLKKLVEEKLLRHLDHKNLNLDVSWFRDVIPTAENIAVVCWQVLAPEIPAGRLLRIRLWETPRNYVDYEGE
jgi:6-pyruvoyltetrahydropterin/6-carboxytetrahydropterin synthase